MTKVVEPSVRETAFTCPHCHALTTQFWHTTFTKQISGDSPVPMIWRTENIDRLKDALSKERDAETRKVIEGLLAQGERLVLGVPEFGSRQDPYVSELNNVSVSSCYNCKKLSVWIYDRLVFPVHTSAPLPNNDMPDHVRADYWEAAQILDLSPRGASALLRLVIQKLCIEFGGKGKSIDQDIAELVTNGLDARVQMMLDSVRVVGNNAVHPGQMDLKDDRETAETLFGLVNLVIDKMISEKKRIEEVYSSLPQSARDAIDKRDAKSKTGKP